MVVEREKSVIDEKCICVDQLLNAFGWLQFQHHLMWHCTHVLKKYSTSINDHTYVRTNVSLAYISENRGVVIMLFIFIVAICFFDFQSTSFHTFHSHLLYQISTLPANLQESCQWESCIFSKSFEVLFWILKEIF